MKRFCWCRTIAIWYAKRERFSSIRLTHHCFGVWLMNGQWYGALTDLPLLARFAFALTVFLIVPSLCRRVHLPPVVGLLAA